MKRAGIFLAVLALVAVFALSGGTISSCNLVAFNADEAVGSESSYRNHGQYVKAAAAYLNGVTNLSEECHDCVIAQFAQSDPGNGSCNFSSEDD